MNEERLLEKFEELLMEKLRIVKEEIIKEIKCNRLNTDDCIYESILTTAEVKRQWGCSRTTLNKMMKEKKIAPVGKHGRSFKFRSSELIKVFGEPISKKQ